MNIKPDELKNMGYVLLDQLEHKELVPFIRTFIRKKTKYSVIYYLSNFIVLGFVVYFFAQGYSFSDSFTQFSYGLAIAFALIPLHEFIHVLAYKSIGAKHTSYDANLKNFYFMALTISCILLAHTAMCSGDFGLLSFFEFNKEKNIVTYDDIENKISYFYGRIDERKTNE